jgi:hypothetical protein
MNIGNNADEINQELPSIRRKYKKGRLGNSNINYGVVLKTTHKEISSKPIITEEHIIIKEEPKIIIEKVVSPIETSSKIIMTKTVVEDGDSGKRGKQINITRNEVNELEKTESNKKIARRQKENIGDSVSKVTELTTTTNNNINNNTDGTRGRKIKEEITTKTITTTQTNQRSRGPSTNKKESVEKETINKSQSRSRGRKEEITTTKTTTTTINQRSGSQSQGKNDTKGQISSIKTITTNTTITNERQNNRSKNQSQDKIQKIEIESKQVNTIEKQNSRNKSQDKNQNQRKEIIKEEKSNQEGRNSRNKAQEKYQSSRKQNQDLKSQVVKEVTETTSVNRRNVGNQPTVTTTKTVTTVNQNQNTNSGNQIRDSNSKKEKKKVYSSLTVSTTNKLNVRDSQNNRISGRNSSSSRKKEDNLIQVKKSETLIKNNQKNIINQNAASIFRENNKYNTNTSQVTKSKLAMKENDKKPYSTMTEVNKKRNNISRITINESGKTPKKQYVLNVRKIERIRSKPNIRIKYTNNMEEKEPVKTDFNYKILVVKNFSKEYKTALEQNKDGKINNTARKEINECGNDAKKQVELSPRKNEIIKTARKPLKLNYENYNKNNNTDIKQIMNRKADIKTNLKNKMINQEEQRNSRNKNYGKISGAKTTDNKVTTTTTETQIRMGRNRSDLNNAKNEGKDTKITTTVTKIEKSSGNKKGKYIHLQISTNDRTITDNYGVNTYPRTRNSSTNSKGDKNETVTEIRNSRNKRNENSEKKVIKVTRNVIVEKNGNDSKNNSVINSRSGSKNRNKNENNVNVTETSKKRIRNQAEIISSNDKVEGNVVRKVRAVRRNQK